MVDEVPHRQPSVARECGCEPTGQVGSGCSGVAARRKAPAPGGRPVRGGGAGGYHQSATGADTPPAAALRSASARLARPGEDPGQRKNVLVGVAPRPVLTDVTGTEPDLRPIREGHGNLRQPVTSASGAAGGQAGCLLGSQTAVPHQGGDRMDDRTEARAEGPGRWTGPYENLQRSCTPGRCSIGGTPWTRSPVRVIAPAPCSADRRRPTDPAPSARAAGQPARGERAAGNGGGREPGQAGRQETRERHDRVGRTAASRCGDHPEVAPAGGVVVRCRSGAGVGVGVDTAFANASRSSEGATGCSGSACTCTTAQPRGTVNRSRAPRTGHRCAARRRATAARATAVDSA